MKKKIAPKELKEYRSNKIITIPNIITFFRFLLIIPVIFLLSRGEMFLSIGLMMLFIILDMLDGAIARAFNMRSELGEKLDPFVDGVFSVSLLLGAYFFKYIGFAAIALIFSAKIISFFTNVRHLKNKKPYLVSHQVQRVLGGLIILVVAFTLYTGSAIWMYIISISYLIVTLAYTYETLTWKK